MLGEKDLIYFGAIMLLCNGYGESKSIEIAKNMYNKIFDSNDEKDNMILE